MKRLICMSEMGGAAFMAGLFGKVIQYVPHMELNKNDTLLFEGGTDVNPAIYGEQRGRWTSDPDVKRDMRERLAFQLAEHVGASAIGICRGSQFLTVMNGGSLIQDVTAHCQDHFIRTKDGRRLLVTSTHHQMMAPPKDRPFELIGWADHARSQHYWNGNSEDCREKLEVTENLEPEIVWYPETRSLAIQGHPEYLNVKHEFPQYCLELISGYIFEGNH